MTQTIANDDKNNYPKASRSLVWGAILSYIGFVFLLIAFCAPYWIESYPESFSSFKHMGLWEYCFEDFQYPYYQFPKLFNGCHHIFSHEYYVIREYLLPGWLIFVQACVTIAFLCTFGSLSIMACEICRWPLKVILRYEWLFTSIALSGIAFSSLLLFLASTVYGGNAYRRDWLMYPKFNVLSWGYSCCIVAFMVFGIASIILYRETIISYRRRQEGKSLVMQMQETHTTQSGFHTPHFSVQSRGGYI